MNYHQQKVKKVWDKIAGEPVQIFQKNGCTYALGSKEACEKLHDSFKSFARKVGYSEKQKTWWFKLNPNSVVFE